MLPLPPSSPSLSSRKRATGVSSAWGFLGLDLDRYLFAGALAEPGEPHPSLPPPSLHFIDQTLTLNPLSFFVSLSLSLFLPLSLSLSVSVFFSEKPGVEKPQLTAQVAHSVLGLSLQVQGTYHPSYNRT